MPLVEIITASRYNLAFITAALKACFAILLPSAQARKLMISLHYIPRLVAILAVALTSVPAVAQSRPRLLDVPPAAGILVPVSPMNSSVLVRVAVWQQAQVQVRELDLADGGRPATSWERLGFVAAVTALGAGLGYGWWHSCNDPESDAIWSCIVAPRRLSSSVRFGAYSGLAVGLAAMVGDLRVATRPNSVRTSGPRILIDHQPRRGFIIGLNFRF